MLNLILLPGMEGSSEFFVPLIANLGSSVKTQVISYPQDCPLGYAQLTEFVEKRLPVDSPYALLGESFSGPIAVNIAAKKPANLQAVILVCTFVRSPIPIPKAFHSLACLFPASWIPTNIIAHFLLGRDATPNLLTHLKKVLSGIANTVFRERGIAILNVDVSQELAEINVPLLYIRAAQDRIIPKKASDLIISLQPNTEVIEIVGPHFILQTQPKQSAEHILRFLQRWMSPLK